ncbi:calcyphosin-like protein isoform X2 [Parasteatoda tepidariorum]|uniref:calcyphosin-like protein isoform X2 n=1 Tax=Parasteatoda tepidariorum TaxID=114398 RepID=UPI000A2C0A57|nr:calcyphosin-like protein isoform X2 [Parasteatoda tepidariorum]
MSEVLEKLRQLCRARGANGIIGLSRAFRLMDDNRDKKLHLDEMKLGLQEYGADLGDEEMSELFNELDKDSSGTVSFEEFLKAVRPPLSEERLEVIGRAFSKMDNTGDGSVTLDDLRGVYSAKQHPDVIDGKKTEEEVLLKFLSNFDSPNNSDGKVFKQEFIDYYAGVSASIDLDEYFVTMMEKAWQL